MSWGWHSDYGRYEVGEELGEDTYKEIYVVHYNTYNHNLGYNPYSAEHHRVVYKSLDAAIKKLKDMRKFWRERCEIEEDAFFIEKRITKKVVSVTTEKLDC